MIDFFRKNKKLILNLIFPLAVGGLSSLLTRKDMDIYQKIVKPPFAPPGWIFPVAWTILYLLMGYGHGLIRRGAPSQQKTATGFYLGQLGLNFLWPLLFFKGQLWFISLLVLLSLWAVVLLMVKAFAACSKKAAALQIPYVLWLTFAAYLNWMVAILN